jgi:pyridine nucleotide-disulfide oxidoreductase domain-containing protein 1
LKDKFGKQYAILYDELCVCTGVQPNLVATNPCIIGLRDTHSASELATRLKSAKKVAVLGNGGIALELIHEVCNLR